MTCTSSMSHKLFDVVVQKISFESQKRSNSKKCSVELQFDKLEHKLRLSHTVVRRFIVTFYATSYFLY